ncbi:MAG: hypothetical protein M3340_02880 [Actinomycetota bacterium]|nr:hypothetical protein [Actinomycetota bacterium]
MTRATRIAVAVATGTALALPAPAAGSHQYDGVVGCAAKRVRNVQIVALSPEARVFRKLTHPSGGPGGSVAYACMRRSGPITRLKGSGFGGGQMRPLLAGRYVAFQHMHGENEDHEESSLIVLDMKTGRISFEQPRDGTDLGDWVVKRNGSVAWFTYAYQGGDPGGVYKLDSTTGGKPQRLAGPEGTAYPLRLSSDRRTVFWKERDGTEHSAPID